MHVTRSGLIITFRSSYFMNLKLLVARKLTWFV